MNPPPNIRGELENFEEVYFPGAGLFRNFRGVATASGAVSHRGDLVLFNQ